MILKKKNKIHEIKYYILYNYKSAFEAIASNFSHSSIITPRPLLRVIISVLMLSNESVSDLSREVKIHALSFRRRRNDRFNRFNGIPFHHQS